MLHFRALTLIVLAVAAVAFGLANNAIGGGEAGALVAIVLALFAASLTDRDRFYGRDLAGPRAHR